MIIYGRPLINAGLTCKTNFCFEASKEISAGKGHTIEYLTADALILTQKIRN